MIHRVRPVGPDLHFEDGARALAGNALDGDPDRGQVFGETAVVRREINEFAQPMGRESHCSWKNVSSYSISSRSSSSGKETVIFRSGKSCCSLTCQIFSAASPRTVPVLSSGTQ